MMAAIKGSGPALMELSEISMQPIPKLSQIRQWQKRIQLQSPTDLGNLALEREADAATQSGIGTWKLESGHQA